VDRAIEVARNKRRGAEAPRSIVIKAEFAAGVAFGSAGVKGRLVKLAGLEKSLAACFPRNGR